MDWSVAVPVRPVGVPGAGRLARRQDQQRARTGRRSRRTALEVSGRAGASCDSARRDASGRPVLEEPRRDQAAGRWRAWSRPGSPRRRRSSRAPRCRATPGTRFQNCVHRAHGEVKAAPAVWSAGVPSCPSRCRPRPSRPGSSTWSPVNGPGHDREGVARPGVRRRREVGDRERHRAARAAEDHRARSTRRP